MQRQQRSELQRAKQPRTALAGPYGHPFHPMLVTLPIGAWVSSLVFDIIALAAGADESTFAQGAYWLIAIGIIGAVLAAIFGLIDLLAIPRQTAAFKTGVTHMVLNLSAVVLFVVNFAIRTAQRYEEATVTGLILTLIALAVLGASGWLGGKLAYHYGVRVADEQTQSEGFVR
jgi:uncharacterized membrane protein